MSKISETELIQMADDMVACFTSMNAQNYGQFLECRENFIVKIKELVSNNIDAQKPVTVVNVPSEALNLIK